MKRSTSWLLSLLLVLPPGRARGTRYTPPAFVPRPSGGDHRGEVFHAFAASGGKRRPFIFPKFLLNPVENNTIIKTKIATADR